MPRLSETYSNKRDGIDYRLFIWMYGFNRHDCISQVFRFDCHFHFELRLTGYFAFFSDERTSPLKRSLGPDNGRVGEAGIVVPNMAGINILESFLKLWEVTFRNKDFQFDVITHGLAVLIWNRLCETLLV